VKIAFGEYAPDLPALGNEGSPAISNAIPQFKGYKQLNSLSAYSTALTAYCRGAFTGTDIDGNVVSYAGDATKLYRLVSTTMTDSSKAAGYTLATDSYWEFVQYGNSLIASDFDDTPQTLTLGGTTFADLTGTPPKFRHVAVGGPSDSFLIVGNTFDGVDGNVPYRVRWPGIGTITSWTVSASTQADFQDLPSVYGWVQGIHGGEINYVFQERAITRMAYVGSPVVFQFDKVEGARGSLAPRGSLQVGAQIFYLSDDGFYVLVGGVSVPIGAGKVDKTFLNDVNTSYLHRITTAAIPDDKVVIWSYPSSNSVDGTPDKCLLYNWASKMWCPASFNHELIYRAQTVGVTLDGLDALYASIDAVPFSLDSRVWMGGRLQLAAFDTSHKQAFFTGTALDATFETSETQIFPAHRAEVNAVVPLVDGGIHTVQVGTRETQASAVTWSSAATENTSGICPVRSNSRYHRFRVNNTGSFTDAMGVEIPDDMVADVGSR
jgi:hypothetical protein